MGLRVVIAVRAILFIMITANYLYFDYLNPFFACLFLHLNLSLFDYFCYYYPLVFFLDLSLC